MNSILYLVFNKDIYLKEVHYSVISLIRQQQYNKEKVRIIIMSDYPRINIEYLLQYNNVEYIEITNAMKEKWLSNTYIFTIKIEALKYYFQIYSDKVLFVDSDTAYTHPIHSMFENITDNKFVMDYPYASNYYEVINSNGNNNFTLPMHIEEAKRDERFYKYIHNYGYLDNQKLYPVNYSMIPCNSGVIGLTYNNRELLNDVYSVTKKLWEQYEYIPSEEYAFSYIFNKNGIVSYAYNHILHYHRAKFLRLLVANSLGIFFYDDQLQFKKLLNFFSFDENALSNMSINDIPYFVMYLQEMFGCKIPPVGAVEDINNVQTIRNILKYRNLKINRTFDEFVNFLYEIN